VAFINERIVRPRRAARAPESSDQFAQRPEARANLFWVGAKRRPMTGSAKQSSFL
jgi:hypothetical protein